MLIYAKKQGEGAFNYPIWANHLWDSSPGLARNPPAQDGGETGWPGCGRTVPSIIWPRLALAVQ